jgi:hexosaminidase
MSNQINRFLQQHGRSMMGWNELINEDLDPQIAIQFWRGDKNGLIDQIRKGRKTVLSNFEAYYLDHAYVHSPLEKVYKFEAVPAALEAEYLGNILGIEAPLWTEFVPNRARLDWQVFPRLFAVAESAWTNPERKNYEQFLVRLLPQLELMEQTGIGYAGLTAADPGRFQRLGGWISLFQEGSGVRQEREESNF